MNTKSFIITCVVVYIVANVLGFLIHGVWLGPVYEAMEADAVFRPKAEMDPMMWVMFSAGAVWVVVFVYIFIRGREGKGLMEGVRYGVLMGLFYSLTVTFNSYVIYPIPFDLAVKWFFGDFATVIISGVITSLVYKPSN